MPVFPAEIGPYRVVRPLGRGGMGTVLLAEDSRLARLVALKTFSGPEAGGAHAREQLMSEARAAAALSHPNIASVHDVLDVDGQVVIVFEYVEGDTLASRLERGPLPTSTALAIATELADALAAAHQQGIIHRDLKPGNVILTADDHAKVLDFGIARVMPSDPSASAAAQTTPAMFVGTVGYAAPEQCLGQPVDARADIFSLAVVLFEMLAGQRPYPGDDVTSVVRAMLQNDPPHLADAVPAISPALDSLVGRALSRNPVNRPATVREFREGLRAIRTDRRPAPVVVPPRRGWMAAVLVVALGTAALMWSLINRPDTVAPQTGAKPVVAVMPLTNASGDSAKDHIPLGVAESLITRLAALPSITVLSRAAVADARGRVRELPALASELGATYFVDGSVQQIGERLRINLSLVRPDASVAWADTAEGSFNGIFELQTRLASALAQALVVQLSAADRANLAEQPTMNPDALSAYWRGRALLERRDVQGNTEAALAAFDEAVGLDPRFADAHAARGEALWGQYLDTKDPGLANAAVDAGVTALNIDPDRANVRYSLALTFKGRGELEQAKEELERALAIRPNYDDARRELGDVLARQGLVDDAVVEFNAAIALRPKYWSHHYALGVSLLRAQRYQAAADAFSRAAALQSDNANAHQNLGAAYHFMGRLDAALASYQRAISIRPSPFAYANIGAIYHQQGEFEKAIAAYREALALRPNAAGTHRNLGDALLRLARKDEAQAEYREAVRLARLDVSVNPRDAEALAALALYLAKLGDHQAARQQVVAAERLGPPNALVLYRTAAVHALGNERDLALDALEAAVARGYSRTEIAGDDDLASLKPTDRFQALLRARP